VAGSGLKSPWTQIDYGVIPAMTAHELASGHPSAPGFRDRKPLRAGQPGPGVDGTPGVPLLRPSRRTVNGIFPANSGGGFPIQPEAEYLGESDF